MIVKTLSLTQPWASLVAAGVKRVETRGYRTSHRGPLAIHATREVDLAACDEWEIALALGRLGLAPTTLPLSAVLAVVDLVDCQPTASLRATLAAPEIAYGNYADGRYGWLLDHLRVLRAPLVLRGKPWIFPADVPDELLEVGDAGYPVAGAG